MSQVASLAGSATAGTVILKLRHGAALTPADEAVLTRLTERARPVERGDILHDGSKARTIVAVLAGWACRYRQLDNGKRQITAIYVPGDLCEPFGAAPPETDYTFAALSPATLAFIPPQSIRQAAHESARIEEALWWDLLLADSIAREHMVCLGRRSATERLAHFFCEMNLRLGMVGLADGDSLAIPLTQVELADLFGLSSVHVNRSLQELRGSGLLSFRSSRATIHDLRALQELSMFDLDRARRAGVPPT